MSEVLNVELGYTVEIVKQAPDNSIAGDEIFPMGTCPVCQHDVALCWDYCPGCGEKLDVR